jgi:alkanesulfonate monooxygenase SsuD/methylene tetrahydromethanopterin reductase-like flavin-dependent oxidoreductase (luciferase family)
MRGQERLARRAEELGFAALWVRDVPLRDQSFGDIGQVYDPWVYLGWITYPRSLEQQAELAARWRAAVAAAAPGVFKPFAQSFYVDLTDDPDPPPQPLHLGFRGGRNVVFRQLRSARQGHFSYRRIAQQVYAEIERAHPALACYIRVDQADYQLGRL